MNKYLKFYVIILSYFWEIRKKLQGLFWLTLYLQAVYKIIKYMFKFTLLSNICKYQWSSWVARSLWWSNVGMLDLRLVVTAFIPSHDTAWLFLR